MAGSGRARSSSLSLATATAFDLEGLLHGVDQLSCEHSLADASSDSIKPRRNIAMYGSAAASQAALAGTEQEEQRHGGSEHSLSSTEVRGCAPAVSHSVWHDDISFLALMWASFRPIWR